MMASTGLNFDGVSFSIQCESKEAQVNINGLSTSLDNIKSVVKGGINGLNLVANNLKLLNESSQGVPTTIKNLDNIGTLANNLNALGNVTAMNKTVVNRLKEMNEVSATIETTSRNISSVIGMVEPLQQLSTIDTPTGLTAIVKDLNSLKSVSSGDIANISNNITTLTESIPDLQRFSEIQTPKGFKAVAQDMGILAENIKKIDATTLENVRNVSVQLANAIKPLADEMGKVANGYAAISQMSRTYGVSLTRMVTETKKTGEVAKVLKSSISLVYGAFKKTFVFGYRQVEKLQKSFKKLKSTTKQVALSLLGTRTLFTMIRKAASEYNAFDTSMQKFNQNVWRAFGAQLAPAMEYMMNLFKQFVRVIYSIIKALTGMDLIARANARAMSNYAGATAKAVKELGNLQKFDDLNTVDFPDNSGSGDGGFEQIQLDEIDLTPIQKVIDWAKKLKETFKEAFSTGGWEKVGVVFAEGINDGMTFLLNNIDTIRSKIFKIIDDIVDVINGFIKTIDAGKIAKLFSEKVKLFYDSFSRFISDFAFDELGKRITEFFANLDIKGIIESKGNVWISLFEGLGKTLENTDFTVIGQKISEFLVTSFSTLGKIIDAIPWGELGKAIRDTVTNINWKEVFESILVTLSNVLKGIEEFFSNLFDVDEKTVEKIIGIGTGLGLIFAVLYKMKKLKKGKDDGLSSIAEGLNSLTSGIGKAAETIALLGGLALVLKSVSEVIESFGNSGLSLKDVGLLMSEALGLIAGAFIEVGAAAKLLNSGDLLAVTLLFAGLSAVILSLSDLFKNLSKIGGDLKVVFNGLNGIFTSLSILLGVLIAGALILGSDPLALIAVLALAGALSIILTKMAETLPTILDAVGKFIVQIAPAVIAVMTTIGNIINDIIRSLGVSLPPIINSVGKLFDKIFKGIERVVRAVGDVIVKILETTDRTVGNVFQHILDFINDLGPAVNNLVDNLITAITKLINFMVSGIEYLLNTVIVNPINKVLNKISNNKLANKLGLGDKISTLDRVSIERFSPKLETGTNEIPYEGLYHLHPGEAVVPKKYNPALGGGTNTETNQRLDALINLVENMDFTNVVNIGNKKLYEEQTSFNKRQINKYGTLTSMY